LFAGSGSGSKVRSMRTFLASSSTYGATDLCPYDFVMPLRR
jgi:hypothetical protein